MDGNAPSENEVFGFILDNIDSVPHLEALLLLWNSRPTCWSPQQLGARLYVKEDESRGILSDLARANFAAAGEQPSGFCYNSKSPETDGLVAGVDANYRRQIVRISNMIHSKAVRDFARAFRFTKERD
jgi:hypothetical protein